MSRANSLRREKADDARTQWQNVADALAKAQTGLLESRDALNILKQHRGAARLIDFISCISEMRFLMRERLASITNEDEAARLFDLPVAGQSGRHPNFELKI